MSDANYRGKGRGLIPDPSDKRDYLLSAVSPIKESSFSYPMTPVRDQGQRSTCVGFSSTAVKEYYDNKERGGIYIYSPNHLYYMCKQNDGYPNEDGTSIRVAMKMLTDTGVAPESDWPYEEENVPNTSLLAKDAVTQRIKSYARLTNSRDMLASLTLQGPFVIGVLVTEGFYTKDCIENGIVDISIPADDSSGGHAIAVCGYDADNHRFRVKNSWGTGYGDKGYIWIGRDFFDGPNLIDAWAMVDDADIDKNLILVKPPKTHRWHFPPFRDLFF